MFFDRTTEAIYHFIGLFDIAVEEARLREQYDSFGAGRGSSDPQGLPRIGEAGLLIPVERPEGHQPGAGSFVPPLHGGQGVALGPLALPESSLAHVPAFPSEAPAEVSWQVHGISQVNVVILPFVPIPSQVATVTVQANFLSDADVVGPGTIDFLPVEMFAAQLLGAAGIAQAVAGPGAGALAPEAAILPGAEETLAEEMAAFEAPVLSGLSTSVMHGEAVAGIVINGHHAAARPEAATLAPAAFRAKYGLDEPASDGPESGAGSARDDTPFGADDDGGTSPGNAFAPEDGHTLVTGMNLATNVAVVTTSMIDAGVIVVGGDVINLTSISQLNLASDHDIAIGPGGFAGGATMGYNIVEITDYSSAADRPEEDAPGAKSPGGGASVSVLADDGSDGAAGGPTAGTGTAGGSFSASATATGGESTTSASISGGPGTAGAPAATTAAPGKADLPPYEGLPKVWNIEVYDGDVVQLNAFTQVNFVLDTDQVDFTFHAAATYLSTGENVVFNTAYAGEFGFGYDLIIVGGDFIQTTLVSQINVLLDDDIVVVDGGASVSGGDNLLLNEVMISRQGVDSHAETTDAFDQALEDLGNGGDQLSAAVAQDELFTGVEQLRALYINGDLIKVTAVQQTNIMGDQDQVHAALESFAGRDDAELAVTTGSNVLHNVVGIQELGTDSVVMAQGEVYDDALLYQAELIDTDAAPTEVQLTALASEAVVFLADDMLTADSGGDDDGTALASDGTPSPDAMETMTA